MSILSDYFSKTYINNVPEHNEILVKNRIFLDVNPIQGYVHSMHIPLNYTYYETLCDKLLENNNLMKNQMFSVCANQTSLRIVRFNGNVDYLEESTVYETLNIEATNIFTLDFNNVSYTIDKMNRCFQKYDINEKSYSNQNYQNVARGYWTPQDRGFLYVGCQDVWKDSTKILSKNDRLLVPIKDNRVPAKKNRNYTENVYFDKLEKMEVETNPFIMFQISLSSSAYFTLPDINSFVRKYAPMLGTQQINNILV